MISDDTKDADILDDDFDIDDFEDDWDEQDDDAGIAPEEAGGPVHKGEKTFLQKFFFPIVIAVIALFAGIFVLGQGLTPSAPIDNEVATLNEGASPLDEGRNVTAVSDTTDLIETADFLPPTLPEDSSLRPLPRDDESGQIELADLEAELAANTNDILSSETLDFVDQNPMAAPEIEAETLFEEAPTFADEMINDTIPDESDFADSAQDMFANKPSIDDIVLSDAPLSDNNTPNAEIERDATITDVNMTKEADSLLEGEIEALEIENETLSQTINNNQNTIASLNKEITSLKTAIASLKAQASESSTVSTGVPAQAKVVKAPTPQITMPEAKIVNTKTPRAVKAKPRWALKSAQPGKATLSLKGSNDLKTVEIGSVVSGIGRITSIGIENNRWIVRGTKGTVSQ